MHFNDYSSQVEDKEGFQLSEYYVTTFNYYVACKMIYYVTPYHNSGICNVTGPIIGNPLRNKLYDLLPNMLYKLLCNIFAIRYVMCDPLRNVLNNFV